MFHDDTTDHGSQVSMLYEINAISSNHYLKQSRAKCNICLESLSRENVYDASLIYPFFLISLNSQLSFF